MLSLINKLPEQVFRHIPESLVLLLARFALAAVFWLSGQTKIEGFALNPLTGTFEFGWPSIKDTSFFLFEYEYALPLIPATWATYLATTAEHLLPIMLLLGVGTRLSAFGLMLMTLVIQTFVYPEAYVLHASWAAIALFIMQRGPGKLSLEGWRHH
ncbi:DoxX family protein [Rhodanobacter aciditrophus]|uniref:DoxX family protein n=1 Tax=Rhodanobacter aciditrophus TaxID=1623218 RepID=A0ABW4AYN1_9GAMM